MSGHPDVNDPSMDAVDDQVPSEGLEETNGADSGSRVGNVARSLVRTLEMLRGSTVDLKPFVPERDGPLVEEEFPAGEEIVDRYWVNAPFAYIAITRDKEENENRYRTVEPALSEAEYALLQMLFEDVRDPLVYRGDIEDEDVETVLQEAIRDHLQRYGARIDMQGFYKLFYYLYRGFQGYGRLDPIMHDPHVEDVSCDGYDLPIFVYHDDYVDIKTNVSFGEMDLDNFVIRLAQQSGRHISIGDPMAETTLPDGSRAQLSLGKEVTPRGSAFTIRKYSDEPFTPIDLLNYGTFNIDQMAFLWLAIEQNKSLIFAGGTASGKTTSMNAISMFIPPRSKVLSIEDTRELSLYHDNWLSSVTRERLHEGTDVTMYDLLRAALRHRPEYIIVGEVRGEEAITLFQAMNTGHTTYSTMHADSVRTVINRLENEPINVPRPMVASLDILLVQTLTRLEGERVRRNKTIAEIEGIDQRTGELDYSTSFTWNAEDDTFASSGSIVLDEIKEELAWSQSELLTELQNRRRFLRYLHDQEVTDYRRFTAMINEYYTDPERALDLIEDGSTDEIDPIPSDN
ncbi:MAG: flagellar protein FlaI [Halobacteriales archaeon]|jgi:flagellar protein FlaI